MWWASPCECVLEEASHRRRVDMPVSGTGTDRKQSTLFDAAQVSIDWALGDHGGWLEACHGLLTCALLPKSFPGVLGTMSLQKQDGPSSKESARYRSR